MLRAEKEEGRRRRGAGISCIAIYQLIFTSTSMVELRMAVIGCGDTVMFAAGNLP